MSWKDMIKDVAPNLAAALPPPFGVIAGTAVRAALGISEKATDDDVEKQLAKASPEILLKIKEADNDFKLGMANIGVDLEKVAAGDRDSARKREVDTGDYTNRVLAAGVVGFWAVLNFLILTQGVNESVADPLLYRLLGTLDGALLLVLQYYFGSSASSHQKSELIATMKKTK
jgi:hypothetical protein